MNNKIKNYLDVLFIDMPRTQKAVELKEELLSNMNERFDDYLREGKSEVQSYSLVVANMGDIDELLKEVMPDADFKKEAQFYRNRKARNIAIGIILYMTWLPIIVGLAQLPGDAVIIGVMVMFMFVAIATSLIVYTSMSTPPEYKGFTIKTHHEQTSKGRIFQSILSIYWSVVVLLYFLISFTTRNWHISWIIWPCAAIVCGIIGTIYNMRDAE